MRSEGRLSPEHRRRLPLYVAAVIVSCVVLIVVGAWEIAAIYAVVLAVLLGWIAFSLRRS